MNIQVEQAARLGGSKRAWRSIEGEYMWGKGKGGGGLRGGEGACDYKRVSIRTNGMTITIPPPGSHRKLRRGAIWQSATLAALQSVHLPLRSARHAR